MSDSEPETSPDLSNSDVVTKYKAAAEICNKAIAKVLAACQEGAKVVDLCQLGDNTITEEVKGIFAKKKLEKGVAFPTCVSVNHVVGHYSPPIEDTTTLNANDVVKIDIGVHIDGFTSVQAQTLVVQPAQEPVKGRAADAIQAARTAFDAALRLMRPGHKISEVAKHLNKIAEVYGCQLVEGVMSHEMKQFVIDGNKCVLNRPSPEQKVEDGEFEENEVYAIDIVVSTGEGKTKVLDEKQTTVFKRALDTAYSLKLKAARAVFSIINRDFPAMPFTTRALVAIASSDKEPLGHAQLSLGIKDCVSHGLLHAYPVLYEKTGEIVTQIKGTVLLMPNGSDVITKSPAQAVESDKKVEDPELLDLLAAPIKKEKKKANKEKKKAAAA
uniref:Peptidase M24 domain-containing protein n=1 Tax=Dunaliella tertiolecta TaxID=3047 RepID=A0A7S3RAT8_DUNTE|mmetsp:Transcript_8020/g.21351  ORF Transcript_8020/g.21351 Transcript_8020/m.21351 type:complete len:384 (-) Transcript_8020:421-1572(-)|eukprot:CAMPEP_0202352230 /NCGR_PEP_ID=MMETSP1126-20121109/8509_1 /ASSEMBLY_ACC=CAM_ASM_000457 /TAXON_ID=3047 /ORGANISM="Dunaliella tertiolecta, Strain CCMP1320" /LENGTH=383 /DNA_ID=CAMNT_0048944407 /DNA_START=305 /DNA_END=1456 /DNA_ORIENTATION=-